MTALSSSSSTQAQLPTELLTAIISEVAESCGSFLERTITLCSLIKTCRTFCDITAPLYASHLEALPAPFRAQVRARGRALVTCTRAWIIRNNSMTFKQCCPALLTQLNLFGAPPTAVADLLPRLLKSASSLQELCLSNLRGPIMMDVAVSHSLKQLALSACIVHQPESPIGSYSITSLSLEGCQLQLWDDSLAPLGALPQLRALQLATGYPIYSDAFITAQNPTPTAVCATFKTIYGAQLTSLSLDGKHFYGWHLTYYTHSFTFFFPRVRILCLSAPTQYQGEGGAASPFAAFLTSLVHVGEQPAVETLRIAGIDDTDEYYTSQAMRILDQRLDQPGLSALQRVVLAPNFAPGKSDASYCGGIYEWGKTQYTSCTRRWRRQLKKGFKQEREETWAARLQRVGSSPFASGFWLLS